MAGAVAVGADACLFREQGKSEAQLVAELSDVLRRGFDPERGKQMVLILKAEGVEVPTDALVSRLQAVADAELPGVDVRATVLGHLVRGGSPSYYDRLIAGRLGAAAVESLLQGHHDEMVAWQPHTPGGLPTWDSAVVRFPLTQMLTETDALLDGSSAVTRRRVRMMEATAGVMAL